MTSSPSCIIAVDLGGTQIRAARYAPDRSMEARVALPTEAAEGKESVISRIITAIRQVWPSEARCEVLAVALGVPGPVNFEQGIVRFAPNLPGWDNVPLRAMLHDVLGVRVFVANDADVAALGELRFGAGRGVRHMVYMTISTGVGGGIILDGHLFTGGHGLGGEIGHMTIEPFGLRCSCGNVGCLETLASGTAIGRRARERVAAGEPSALLDMVGGDVARITARDVSAAAQAGDALAIDVFREAGTYVGVAIVDLMFLLNPSLFVLGGSVTLAGDLLFDPIQAAVDARAPQPYRETARIVRAELGDDVGLWGALALAETELDL